MPKKRLIHWFHEIKTISWYNGDIYVVINDIILINSNKQQKPKKYQEKKDLLKIVLFSNFFPNDNNLKSGP